MHVVGIMIQPHIADRKALIGRICSDRTARRRRVPFATTRQYEMTVQLAAWCNMHEVRMKGQMPRCS
jgi:hypothetical protein